MRLAWLCKRWAMAMSAWCDSMAAWRVRDALYGLLASRPSGASKAHSKKSAQGGSCEVDSSPLEYHAPESSMMPESGRMRYSVGAFFAFFLVLQ